VGVSPEPPAADGGVGARYVQAASCNHSRGGVEAPPGIEAASARSWFTPVRSSRPTIRYAPLTRFCAAFRTTGTARSYSAAQASPPGSPPAMDPQSANAEPATSSAVPARPTTSLAMLWAAT
jgi:hypothetical protein